MTNQKMVTDSLIWKDRAEQVLAECIGEERVVKWLPGHNNWVFITDDGKTPYLVKFISEMDRVRLEVEVALLQFLAEKTDVPVPGIVKLQRTERGGYLIRELLEGQSFGDELKECLDPTVMFAQAGEILARLHSIEFVGKGLLTPEMSVQEVQIFSQEEYLYFLDRLYNRGYLNEGDYRRLKEIRVTKYFSGTPNVLCHCDYTFNNIIASDGQVVGIIDLEWASAAPCMDDIAAFDLVAYLYGYEQYLGHFFAGYESQRAIPEKYFTYRQFYRFYRLATMLSYQVGPEEERFNAEFHTLMRNEFERVLRSENNFLSD